MRPSPSLICCAAVLLIASAAFAQEKGSFSFVDTEGDHLDVLKDGKPVIRYQYVFDASSKARLEETYKPILHVMDAEGRNPITKGAGGQFTHHRGWMLGWMKITTPLGTADCWHMMKGSMIHRKFVSQKAGSDSATFTALLEWQGPTEAPIIEEERTYTVHSAPAPAYALVEVRSELRALAGETILDGDPEHAGLQFRPANEIDRTQTSYVFPKAHAVPNKDVDYPWVAENFHLSGKTYTVAFLNHPENPRDARFSAYRDYGRFGAFFRSTIPANGKLVIRGQILVSEDNPLTPELIQNAANQFSGTQSPTPPTTVIPVKPPQPAASESPAKTEAPKKEEGAEQK